jgi:hypothetical protein
MTLKLPHLPGTRSQQPAWDRAQRSRSVSICPATVCPRRSTPLSRYGATFPDEPHQELFEISADAFAHTYSQAAGPLVKSIMRKTFDSKEKRDQVDTDILNCLNELLDNDGVKKNRTDLEGLLATLGHEGKVNVKDFLQLQLRGLGKFPKGEPALLAGLSTSLLLRMSRVANIEPYALHLQIRERRERRPLSVPENSKTVSKAGLETRFQSRKSSTKGTVAA